MTRGAVWFSQPKASGKGVAKEGGYRDCADYRSRGRAGFEQFAIWRTLELLCSVEEFLFRALDIQDAIIDGAIVALDEKGRS
jgi:hypothetical protein